MKRLFLGGVLLGGVALLGGCPIYPDHTTTACGECCQDSDCSYGYQCSQSACVVAGGSPDATSPPPPTGFCDYPCPTGTYCTLLNGQFACLPPFAGDAGGYSIALPDAGPDAAPDAPVAPVPCNDDTACGGVGDKCIDGLCTAQSSVCSDSSQCVATGEACVDGVCVPTCSASQPDTCPSGYSCDFTLDVCTIGANACGLEIACPGGAACVETRCVPPVGDGGTCPAGLVAVNGGCIPDERAQFACQNSGDGGASSCPTNNICVHGDCYPKCQPAQGAAACTGAGQACDAVIAGGSHYYVCGPANGLGTQCDPATGAACGDGGVCINGYCE
jgi:hypothetical protein